MNDISRTIFDATQRARREAQNRRAVTLFSGIGSSSLALQRLGYRVLAHDKMPEAVATLRANGFAAREVSVADIGYAHTDYDNVEILVGGPPCQPFSQSADNSGEYDPRDMIPEFVRAVRELEPKVFIMEEVQTLTWKRNAAYLARVERDLSLCGYHVEHRILNAAEYTNVGQARKRLFVIGVRNDVARARINAGWSAVLWPEKREEPPVTMAQRLGWTEEVAQHRNSLAPKPGGDWSWVFERPSTTVVGSFRPDVQAAPGYRKAGDGPRQNTPGSVVTTFEERLKLQGLPSYWEVCGSQAKRDLQVGNSCPTPLLEELIDINIP